MTAEELRDENDELRRRLEEAEATVEAIRAGEVDAVVVSGSPGDRVYTLEGADHTYRLLIEVMRQGAATLHRDGTILYCNRYFAELLLRPPERVVGRPLAEFVDGPDAAAAAELLHAGEAHGEVRLRRLGGGTFPAELALSRLPVKDCHCLVVTDLTQQKHYEQLTEVRARLAEADRRKDEFLATLAHELRNPLAPIRNGLHLMKLAGERPAPAIREMMDRQVAQLVRLVDDLLDVSRITQGKIDLRRERLDLAVVLRNSVESSAPLVAAGGHELTVTAPPEGVPVEGDATRLTQVVANLLNNAAKYTPDGGRIWLSAAAEGAEGVVRVRDSGVGIPADMLPQVFDLFTQVARTADRSQGGLGIGLTLARRLVEMHGGTVGVSSPGEGAGSEFVVRLPLASPARGAGGPGSKPPVNRRARRILVVDDVSDAVDSLAALLRMGGHAVQTAGDGPEAVARAAEFAPDLVLLDLSMPGMGGTEAGRRIRDLPGLAGVTLVALTGWGQDGDRQSTEHAGFDAHWVKPIDAARLPELVGAVR